LGALITLLAVSVSALTGEGLYERGHDLEREGKYADAMSAYLECAHIDPYLAERGWGLGLTIVKSLVGLQEGTPDIKSKVGEGTVFTVTLPNAGA